MAQMEVDSSRYENQGTVDKTMKMLAKGASAEAQNRFLVRRRAERDARRAVLREQRAAEKAAAKKAKEKADAKKATAKSDERVSEYQRKRDIDIAKAKTIQSDRTAELEARRASRKSGAKKPATKTSAPRPGVKKDGTPSKRTPARNPKDATTKVPGTRSRGGAPTTKPVRGSKAPAVPKVAVPKPPRGPVKPVTKVAAPTARRRAPKKP